MARSTKKLAIGTLIAAGAGYVNWYTDGTEKR